MKVTIAPALVCLGVSSATRCATTVVSLLARREFVPRYRTLFMAAFAKPATRGRHADVMLRILGHFKRLLDKGDRDELVTAIDDYRRGAAALIVPMTLFRHHLRRHPVEYLREQTYFKSALFDVDVVEGSSWSTTGMRCRGQRLEGLWAIGYRLSATGRFGHRCRRPTRDKPRASCA